MKSNLGGITSLVLVIVASSSLISMIALTRVDNIVHTDLYRYGLNFSYEWAMPYWTMTTFVFAMGWVNIFMAIVFQFYVLAYGRGKAGQIPLKKPWKTQEIVPAETTEAATRETITPPMEVELGTPQEDPVTFAETPQETHVLAEETAPLESIETEQFEEIEREKEPVPPFESVESEFRPKEENEEAKWTAEGSVETTREAPPEEYLGTTLTEEGELVNVRLQEEPSYAEKREIEPEETQRRTFETEIQATFPLTPEVKAKTKEKEKNQQSEAELTEHY